MIASRTCLGRETLVDEEVIAHTRDRRAYAEALLAFSNPRPHLVGATALIRPRQISQRISLIAQEVSMSPSRVASFLAVSAVVVTVATSLAATSLPMVSVQAQSEQVHKPGDGVVLPVVVRAVKPEYPTDLIPEKIQGSVFLRCVVLADGTIGDIEITKALHPRLDREAGRAATLWLFKPGTKNGKPVPVEITLELTFTLK